jgi:uncharacterized membrane protein YpjA
VAWRVDRATAFLHRFRWEWWSLVPILAADVAGILFGWSYYVAAGQFVPHDLDCSATASPCQPWWMWPLVADSPNAVLVIAAAIVVFRLAGWRSRVLDATAFVLNVYVGLWTTTLFLSYPRDMGTFQLGSTNNILFLTHMGMPLQALTLLHLMRRDAWSWTSTAVLGAAAAAYVAVDYWGPHLHPAPFLHGRGPDVVVGMPGDSWMAAASPLLMAVAFAAWLFVAARPWAPRARRA